jgi:hypothetical protein
MISNRRVQRTGINTGESAVFRTRISGIRRAHMGHRQRGGRGIRSADLVFRGAA